MGQQITREWGDGEGAGLDGGGVICNRLISWWHHSGTSGGLNMPLYRAAQYIVALFHRGELCIKW